MSTLAGRARPHTVCGMRTLNRAPGARARLRRAATMLEFALILPMFMFMLIFSIDMGHLVLVSGAMQDATYSAARTGAQVGGAGIDAEGQGSRACPVGRCNRSTAWRALKESADQIPGPKPTGLTMTIVHGASCTAADNHVVITADYQTTLITPGLGPLLAWMGQKGDNTKDRPWGLSATAVARCEVIRS